MTGFAAKEKKRKEEKCVVLQKQNRPTGRETPIDDSAQFEDRFEGSRRPFFANIRENDNLVLPAKMSSLDYTRDNVVQRVQLPGTGTDKSKIPGHVKVLAGIGAGIYGVSKAIYGTLAGGLAGGLTGAVTGGLAGAAIGAAIGGVVSGIKKLVSGGNSNSGGRTFISQYSIPKDKDGYTKSNMKLGRDVHKEYKKNETNNVNKFKEYNLSKGKRADFIDFENKIIYELKPDNPKQKKKGEKQLKEYLDVANKKFGGGWKGVLDLY